MKGREYEKEGIAWIMDVISVSFKYDHLNLILVCLFKLQVSLIILSFRANGLLVLKNLEL